MADVLSSIKEPSVDDVKAFVNVAKTEGLTFFSDTCVRVGRWKILLTYSSLRILNQLVKFPRMFDFWVALGQGLWKKRDSLIPSGGTPEEQSNSAAVLNRILDRLIVTAIPEHSRVDRKPNVYYATDDYQPQDQGRILTLLDLMTLTHRVAHSIQLVALISQPHKHLPVKYEKLIVPLIPKLKVRLPQHPTTEPSVAVMFLRTFVERYLQDLLGGPPKQPGAVEKKVNCGCQDCVKVNQFLWSDTAVETFRVAQHRRNHIEDQFRTAVQGGVTFTTITHGSPHTLQVTKRHETFAAGKWKARVQKARAFLAVVGTPEELARIMGERYSDVQAALAGTKPYEMGTPTLVAGGAVGAATSATDSTTSGTQAGPVVAGVKRKAEDEDVIDLTSD